MSTLIREDGTRFVLRTYREQLTRSKRSLLKQRLRFLAEQHGEYVHISTSNTDPTYINAVFSPEQGYLLGEIVWQHLGQPSHLIYCERHPSDQTQIIVVVVVDHTIYLDTLLADDEITGELLALLAVPQPFKILLYGHIPIGLVEKTHPSLVHQKSLALATTSEDISFEHQNLHNPLPSANEQPNFVLPASMMSDFTILEKSLFSELSPRSEYELQPLPRVLTSKLLTSSIPWPFIIIMITLVLLLTLWFFYPTPPEQISAPAQTKVLPENPYTQFYEALSTPGAQALVENLIKMIDNMTSLPGWQAQTFNYDGEQYTISLMRIGGDISWLTNWAKQNHYSVTLTTNGANITASPSLPARQRPQQIYPTQQILSFIDERLSQIVDDDGLLVGDAEPHGQAQEIKIILNLNGMSPSLLVLIGRILGNDLPISIDNVQLSEDNSNLLNGTIQFSVWGN